MAERQSIKELGVVVLAAGKGTRMESARAKVLHPVAGKPMLAYVLAAARELRPERIVVVIGHEGDEVRGAFSDLSGIRWVRQRSMRGTGDAVKSAAVEFEGFTGSVLVLYGDIPGVRGETLRRLAMVHNSSRQAVTLLTAELDDPSGYGRIVLNPDGSVARIVEDADADEEELEICEINTGIGLYEASFLFPALERLRPANARQEYYLTDLVGIASGEGMGVGRLRVRDAWETLGINDRESLADVSLMLYERKAVELLERGVTLDDPGTVCLEPAVEVGADSVLGASVSLKGVTSLGRGVQIGAGAELEDCEVGDGVSVGKGTSMRRVRVGEGTSIGPNTVVGEDG